MHAGLKSTTHSVYPQLHIAAHFQPAHVAAVAVLLRIQVVVDKVLGALKAIHAQVRAGLAVAIILVGAFTVISHAVLPGHQLEGNAVTGQIHGYNIATGLGHQYPAGRQHHIGGLYLIQVAAQPAHGDLHRIFALRGCYLQRDHSLAGVLKGIQPDQGAHKVKGNLGNALIVNIGTAKAGAHAAAQALPAVQFIGAQLAGFLGYSQTEMSAADHIGVCPLAQADCCGRLLLHREIVLPQHKLLSGHQVTGRQAHGVRLQN